MLQPPSHRRHKGDECHFICVMPENMMLLGASPEEFAWLCVTEYLVISGKFNPNTMVTKYSNQWRSYTQAYLDIWLGITSVCPGIRKGGLHWNSQKYCILQHKRLPFPQHKPFLTLQSKRAAEVVTKLHISISPTLTREFPSQRLLRHIGARALL